MARIRIISLWLLLAGLPLTTFSADAVLSEAPAAQEVHKQEEGLTAHAVELWTLNFPGVGRFPITNSMVVTWGVALALIIFAQTATRRMKDVPTGAQNFWEWLVESLYGFLEGVIGHDLVRKIFWFFATIFIFIFFSNWMGLIPGFG